MRHLPVPSHIYISDISDISVSKLRQFRNSTDWTNETRLVVLVSPNFSNSELVNTLNPSLGQDLFNTIDPDHRSRYTMRYTSKQSRLKTNPKRGEQISKYQ